MPTLRIWSFLFVVVLIVSLSSCGQEAAPAASDAASVEPTPVNVSTFDERAVGEQVVIRWFVGLGAGTQPAQIPLQIEAVQQFNAMQDRIYLTLEIVDNDEAYNELAKRIASGDAPDILGPVGLRGRNGFVGQLVDLTNLIETNNVDLSQYDPVLLDYYNVEGQGQIGLPYAIYPSFLYVNKALFDAADLPYPPQQFGEPYNGQEWNIDTLRELAMQLTLDAAGNNALSPDFDPTSIVQYGFHPQWVNQDVRSIGSLFGAGSLIDAAGNAQMPDHWREAIHWYYNAMAVDYFAPAEEAINSETFGSGNVFNSGRLAMAWSHIWYTSVISDVPDWDIAVVPSYNGIPTAKLHADTFSIMRSTQHPEEAFEVMLYLLQSQELIQAYGAMSANQNAQTAYFEKLDRQFAETNATTVNWQVAIDSLQYPDDPSHEADLPNYLESLDDIQTFMKALRIEPMMDVDTEIDALIAKLQMNFERD
jgi:multiple sugar transport system substrate-binding protein